MPLRPVASTLADHPRAWTWVFVAVAAAAGALALFTYQAAKTTVASYALDAAQQQAQTMSLVRNYYSEHIVTRAQAQGWALSHDMQQPRSLPLPATFMLEVSEYFKDMHHDAQVQLYSDLPFPWRSAERQLDDFQRDALAQLRRDPEAHIERVETIGGEAVLRYARADRMAASCVACHNQYPGTPKRDWQIGDVRGALEVRMRLQPWQDKAQAVLNRSFGILGALLLTALLALAVAWRRMRTAWQRSDAAAQALSEANSELTREIDQRAQVERTLRVSETKLATIFEAVPDGVVVADTRGIMSQVNAAVCEMFGYANEALIGQNITLLMTTPDAQTHDGHLQRHLQTGQENMLSGPRVVTAQRRDGSTFALRVTVRKTQDGAQGAVMYIAVLQDHSAIVTQQRHLIDAKNRAEEASRLKTRFLANMSHEIRTPMNGIVGMTELALATPLNEEQRNYLSLVQESADHLLHIINGILDFSKIEAGAVQLEQVQCSLHQLLQQTLRSFEANAQAKGLSLHLTLDPEVPDAVFSDPVRLRQILNNLLGNAIKFTQQGQVHLRARAGHAEAHSQWVHFEVQDSGIGFSPEQAQHLFDAFVQGDGSITRAYGGTGLGLAIVRSMVHLLGGEVHAESEPGQGSRFCFDLPFRLHQPDADAAAEGVSEAPRPQSPRWRVLLVEDHEVNQILAQAMLKRLGHDSVLAVNGQEALKQLAQHDFDVVLLDVMMPVMDGLSALRAMQARATAQHPHPPVIMMTAHALSGDREKYLDAGAAGYIAKPYNLKVLDAELRRVCAGPAP